MALAEDTAVALERIGRVAQQAAHRRRSGQRHLDPAHSDRRRHHEARIVAISIGRYAAHSRERRISGGGIAPVGRVNVTGKRGREEHERGRAALNAASWNTQGRWSFSALAGWPARSMQPAITIDPPQESLIRSIRHKVEIAMAVR